MANPTDNFDRSLLPDEAQQLNVDADGNITTEGRLREHLGPRTFRVTNGRVIIIDRGNERAPNSSELDEIRAVLNSPLQGSRVVMKEVNGGPRFQLLLREGDQERSVPEVMIDAVRARLAAAAQAAEDRSREEAATDEKARQAAEARRQAEESFVTTWSRRREALNTLPQLDEVLKDTESPATADGAAKRFSTSLRRVSDDHAGVQKVHENLNKILNTLQELVRYEEDLRRVATVEDMDLTKAPFSDLLIGHDQGRAALEVQLTPVRDAAGHRLEELTEADTFIKEADEIWYRVAEEIETDSALDIDAFARDTSAPVAARTLLARYIPTEEPNEASVLHLKDVLYALEAINRAAEGIERLATSKGIDLDDPKFASLKGRIRPSHLGEVVTELKQLKEGIEARIAINRVLDPVEGIRGIPDTLDRIQLRVNELNTQVNERASDAILASARQELEGLIPELEAAEGSLNQTRGELEETMGELPANIWNREQIVSRCERIKGQVDGSLAVISTTLTTAREVAQRIPGFNSQRAGARDRLARHNVPPAPTRWQRASAAALGAGAAALGAVTGAYAAVDAQVGEATRERAASETVDERAEGTCIVSIGGNSEEVSLRNGGVFRQVDDGAGAGTTMEEQITDPTQLAEVAQALNTGAGTLPTGVSGPASPLSLAPRTTFVVDESDGTIHRVTQGSAETQNSDRVRGIGRAASNALGSYRERRRQDREARNQQNEARAALGQYIAANNLIRMVTEMQGEGLTREQIISDMRAALDAANPGEAEDAYPNFYGDVYDEVVRLQEADRTSRVNQARRWVGNQAERGWNATRNTARATPSFFRNQFNRLRNWYNGTSNPTPAVPAAAPAAAPGAASNLGRNIAIGAGIGVGGIALAGTYAALSLIGRGLSTAVAAVKSTPNILRGGGLAVVSTLNGTFAGLGEPLTEMSAGAVNAWNYMDEPNYSEMKPAKGWTSPFTWMANGLRRTKNALQWTADKTLRSVAAVSTGAAGLMWGTLGAVPTALGVAIAGSEHGRFWSKNLVPDVFGGADGLARRERGSAKKPALKVVNGGKSSAKKEDHPKGDHPKGDHPKGDHPKEDHKKDDHDHAKAA